MNVHDFLNYRLEKTAGLRRLTRLQKSKNPKLLDKALKGHKKKMARRGLNLTPEQHKKESDMMSAIAKMNIRRMSDKA